MPQTDDFCMVCGDTCTCQSESKRRRPKATPATKKPLDTPQQRSAEHQPERRSPRRVAGRSATEGFQADESDEEDTSMVTAIRALAHLVVKQDLEPFAEHLMPSDYLPPEERAASWRKRTNE